MATTSLWRVHGWLGKLVVYVENPDKTENPKYYDRAEMSEEQAQGLTDVLEYAISAMKTTNQVDNESVTVMRQFIDGVNVSPVTARDTMLHTQREFSKTGGVVAYHGYQSFAPGEATPEIAHEIGMRLARQLWGDRYQVLVATHLDQSNHLHNHFVINTVSHIDGKKFHRTEKDYYDMQIASDNLCREYGLSVVENPKRGKSKHYGEWKAEKEGRPTWRGLIKADIDAAIRQSMTERQFFDCLRKQGYVIRDGKDISVKPPGKEKSFRLAKNLGVEYTIESIRRRILEQGRPERRIIPPDLPKKQLRYIGKLNTTKKLTGLRALYFYYLYRMGVVPKTRQPNPKQVYFLYREDIRFIQNISRETRLLVKHGIDTAEQLGAYKDELTAQSKEVYANRKRLRYKVRKIQEPDKAAAAKSEIAALSEKIGALRREVRLCEDIEKRSLVMKDKIHRANEHEKNQVKEITNNKSTRGQR